TVGTGCQTRPVLPRRVIPVVACAAVLAACNGNSRTASGFCQKLSAAQASFTNGQPDAASVAKQFHRLGSSAPEPVRQSWTALTALFDDLSTVDVKNEHAVQNGYQRALTPAVQQAAVQVTGYVKSTCGFDLAVPSFTNGAGASTSVPAPK
ncbi:MAG: hypothetical protein JWL70_2046, partial [Acidimicrobiia bacterium]|nr:hypothetical protein [Acidimicrobiia bacterium]